ncbi:hypothetical protein N9D01_01005 [Cyclobacteriaceae bacterium]|nr:hypothetical protein [Cyclobacteriaceae bacterium]
MDIFKAILIIIAAFFVLGFVFSILFKVGLILLLLLLVMYVFKKVFL